MYRSGGSGKNSSANRNRFFSPRNRDDPKLLGHEGRRRSRQGRLPVHVLAEMEQEQEDSEPLIRQPLKQHNMSF